MIFRDMAGGLLTTVSLRCTGTDSSRAQTAQPQRGKKHLKTFFMEANKDSKKRQRSGLCSFRPTRSTFGKMKAGKNPNGTTASDQQDNLRVRG